MNHDPILQAMAGSYAGELTFPQVIGLMHEAGVESYFADTLRGDSTYYLLDGTVRVEKSHNPTVPVAQEFSAAGVQAAIRGAQADTVRYPQFLPLIMEAGCVGYRVHVTGRCAIYFGRKGEMHVEKFPGAN